MTDLLLRKAQAVRAGARGDEDYDVIDPDRIVVGRIFEATTSPMGHPGCGCYQAAMQAFARSWHRET